MHQQAKARPVSGEIMTGQAVEPGRAGPWKTAAPRVVDAEFETLPVAAAAVASFVAPPATGAPPGMETLRLGAVAATGRKHGGLVFWTSGILVALAAFWIAGGHAAFHRTPAFRFLDTAGNLQIGAVKARVETAGGRAILFVDGKASNDGAEAAGLPPLQIKVTDSSGLETRYFLGTRNRRVEPGESFAFSSRLELPKDGAKSVSVSFSQEK